MLKKVFVVGAGASAEFGLPVGAELKQTISNLCRTKSDDYYGLKSASPDFEGILGWLSLSNANRSLKPTMDAAKLLHDALPAVPSIDNFVNIHRENPALVAVAKAAIAKSLGDAEANSSLAVNTLNSHNVLDLSKAANTWLHHLFSILCEASDFFDFLKRLETINFISFNYDRCIQQYIIWAARVTFDLSAGDLQQISNAIRITYVYGSLGDLVLSGKQVYGFGEKYDRYSIEKPASSIRTFTEGVREDSIREKIDHILAAADVVVFLGFGFHRLNLGLFSGSGKYPAKRIIATSRGQSENDLQILSSEISDKFEIPSGDIGFDASECRDVFTVYYRYMSSIL